MAFKEGSEHPRFHRSLSSTGVVFELPLPRSAASIETIVSPPNLFEQRHSMPGVSEALRTYPWLDPLLDAYFDHFPEGALDSLRVGRMCYAYAKSRNFDGARTMTLTAAGLAHDIGKPKVPKDYLQSDVVYTKEERLEKLSLHVEEGVRLVIGQTDRGEIDYTDVDKERVRIALIGGAHHWNQDDRGSYPDPQTPWLQTEDLTILKDREVVRVADRVDALRSERSYKKVMSEEETRAYLIDQGNDPEIVDFMLAQVA